MRTAHILRWRRERLPVVRQRRIPAAVIELYRCQDLAVCIIATTWLPESALRSTLKEREDNRREMCACRLCSLRFAAFSLCFSVTERLPPAENYFQDDRRVRESGPFCLRMGFWRGTTHIRQPPGNGWRRPAHRAGADGP